VSSSWGSLHYDDSSNKAVVVDCNDAHFAIGYTGWGEIRVAQTRNLKGSGRTIPTDEWIARVLMEFDAYRKNLSSIAEHIQSALNSLKIQDRRSKRYGLTVILCGLAWNDRPFFTRIPRLGECEHRYYKKRTRRERVLDIQIDPQSWLQVLNSSFLHELVDMRRPDYAASRTAEDIGEDLVKLIRRANRQLKEGHKIGRHCMTIDIGLSRGPAARYHNDGELSVVYAPIMINAGGTFSGIEVSGALALVGRGIAFGGKFTDESDRILFSRSQRAQAYCSLGYADIVEGEFDQAIVKYSLAIDLDPSIAEAYNHRGIAYRNTAKYDLAIEDFSTALQLDPLNAAAHSNRGLAYFNIGKNDLALEDFSQALQIDPNQENAYFNRANLFASGGSYAKAVCEYDLAIENDPLFSDAYNNRGVCYLELGDQARAIKDFDAAIEIDADEYHVYYNRGIARQQLGDLDGALSDFEKALSLEPDNIQLTDRVAGLKHRFDHR
jgi:Tfp pilus assembly protein PilF